MRSDFQNTFYSHLPDAPTSDQCDLVERMERFLFWTAERPAFIIRGYAGTGKTTAIGALVKTLPRFKMKTVLLAPTGRAAKVMAKFSKKPAYTIHKKIYQSARGADGQTKFKLAANLHNQTLFIIDEASMISNQGGLISNQGFDHRSLLADLIEFVYSGENCRMVFIGDIAQLPPVGSPLSPALDPKVLQSHFFLNLKGVELKQVMRQASSSGILMNATALREQTQEEAPLIKFDLKDFQDVRAIDGLELEEELETCMALFGSDETMVITRSNKRANEFNQQIRVRIRGLDEELATGDYLMIVKNNYFWLDEKSPIGFIANGDVAEIMRLGNFEEMYGFRFVNASIRLVDYPQLESLEVKLLIDSIHSNAPALEPGDNKRLFDTVMEDYADEPNRKKKMEALKKNPYFNALQVKFSYAITGHKSQGGQWKAVFVDQGYLTEEMIDQSYARWLYTAITRASERLYLVNFHPRFLEEE